MLAHGAPSKSGPMALLPASPDPQRVQEVKSLGSRVQGQQKVGGLGFRVSGLGGMTSHYLNAGAFLDLNTVQASTLPWPNLLHQPFGKYSAKAGTSVPCRGEGLNLPKLAKHTRALDLSTVSLVVEPSKIIFLI